MTNATGDDNDVQCMQSTKIENSQRVLSRKLENAIGLAENENK
jgi:hypothetical protein